MINEVSIIKSKLRCIVDNGNIEKREQNLVNEMQTDKYAITIDRESYVYRYITNVD